MGTLQPAYVKIKFPMLPAKSYDIRIQIIPLGESALSFELRNQGANPAAYVAYLPFREASAGGPEGSLDELNLSLSPPFHQLAVGGTKAMSSVSPAIVNGELV
jgi:hypothetical protein